MIASRKPRATKPEAAKPAVGSGEICSVRIELRHSKPRIWREVEVPTSITLKVLHDVIQIAIGWFDCHLWEFTIDHQTYGLPTDDAWGAAPDASALKARLRDVLAGRRTVIDYTYDMGDNWEHRLIVTKIRQGDADKSYPRYVGGEWAAPPEDCGGIPGFIDALAAIADPNHPEHAEMTESFDGYDPKLIDLLPIRIGFDRIATRRDAARKRVVKQGA